MTFSSSMRQHLKKKKTKIHTAHISENVQESYVMQLHFSDIFVPDDEADILDHVSGG